MSASATEEVRTIHELNVGMSVVKEKMCWVYASIPSSLSDSAPPTPCVLSLVGLGKPFLARSRSSWCHTCETPILTLKVANDDSDCDVSNLHARNATVREYYTQRTYKNCLWQACML